jgi:ribosomal protein S18 acetylase RimI-like enzyme
MDMLVKLYDLPDTRELFDLLRRQGIEVRRALAADKQTVAAWVGQNFSARWESETQVAFSRQPVSCFIAVQDAMIVGFACHDAICRNFFGPTGVKPEARNKRIGTALLLDCLEDMRNQGFGYAIIGGVGPADYYAKVVGAVPIEGSEPGVYRGLVGPWHFDRDTL